MFFRFLGKDFVPVVLFSVESEILLQKMLKSSQDFIFDKCKFRVFRALIGPTLFILEFSGTGLF